MLQIDVLTLFPELISTPLSQSLMGRAADKGIIEVRAHQLRDWATDKHRRTDDYLCGGGQGMLMKCEPLFAAIEELRRENTRVILMTPQGRVFSQPVADLFRRAELRLLKKCTRKGIRSTRKLQTFP